MSENGKTTSRLKYNKSNGLEKFGQNQLPTKPSRPVLKIKNPGGAPKGNANAFKTGFFTGESKDLRRRVRVFRHHVDAVLAAIKAEQLS